MTRHLRPLLVPCIALGAALWLSSRSVTTQTGALTEAPTGYDNLTNGYVDQATFDAGLAVFARHWAVADGLGPVYNAESCAECHANPVPGAASQVSTFRAGHFDGIRFVEAPGGSLISDRAIDPQIQERILAGNEVRTFRLAGNALGAGFVEAIDSNTLTAIAVSQPAAQRGTFIQVPLLEFPGALRGGRFGWKNEHASLLSMTAAELLDEIGITNPLLPIENTSNGNSVTAFDHAADPEDGGGLAVEEIVNFLRATKAPPRDAVQAATASALRGQLFFSAIGCSTCHVPSMVTAPPGTVINGGALTVSAALGAKIIHPYSDFLLHDVGTGDGIVQNGGQVTRNMLRTPPLWGLRARPRLMHDGASVSRTDAINRHANQAAAARLGFDMLNGGQQLDIINFLNSL